MRGRTNIANQGLIIIALLVSGGSGGLIAVWFLTPASGLFPARQPLRSGAGGAGGIRQSAPSAAVREQAQQRALASPDPQQRDRAMEQLVTAQAKRGDVTGARQTAGGIQDGDLRERALQRIETK